MNESKKGIIIGASSGIGRELARIMADDGWDLGLTARRIELLEELQKEIQTKTVIKKIDVSRVEEAVSLLGELIEELGGMDLAVISAGTGHINPDLEWEKEKDTIGVNVSGFTGMADAMMNYFIEKKSGHLVVISSIAAIRGEADAPAYNASKAYQSNYMQGLRKKAHKLKIPVTVTDIQPGLVDTAMAKGEGLFWVMPVKKAAKQICRAIRKKKKHAYITKRWRIIACFLKILPDWIYNRI